MTTAKELLSPYDLLVVGADVNEVVDDAAGPRSSSFGAGAIGPGRR